MRSTAYHNERADVVGYWAESRIFGGVILFSPEISQDHPLEAYINPLASPFQNAKIFQLSSTQIVQFYNFTQGENRNRNPIPFVAGNNTRLVEWYEAFDLGIFREECEPQRPHCRRDNDNGFFDDQVRAKFPHMYPPR